jgi:hypothetical protein
MGWVRDVVRGFERGWSLRQFPHALATHLMPTRSPIFRPLDSVPGPSLTILPTPSWPPTWPGRVGGSPAHWMVLEFDALVVEMEVIRCWSLFQGLSGRRRNES